MSGNFRRSYWELSRSSSNCILFIHDDQSDILIPELDDKLRATGIRKAYFDCETDCVAQHIAGSVGEQLGLANAPYASWSPPTPNKISVWVPFLDDIVGLAREANGVAIVIDNADKLLAADREIFFELIQAFLIPFHHWLEQKKPCHLCFQMEKNPLVREFFGTTH